MKLFRLQGKHYDPDAEKELVLDTGTDDGSAPEAQSPPQPEPEPTAREEAVAETPSNPVEQPTSQDDFLSAIRAEADKEMAEQEQLAAGESSQGDDALDPGLLDIFKDARTEVEESSLAAELEDIAVQELLNELVGVSSRLGIAAQGPARDRAHESTEADEPSGENPEASEPSAETPAADEPSAQSPTANESSDPTATANEPSTRTPGAGAPVQH